MINFLKAIILIIASSSLTAQFSISTDNVSYETPKEYEIGGIVVDGVYSYDSERLISLSGLRRGKKINVPGDDISQAVRKLWEQNLFSDVQIYKEKIVGNTIFLKISLKERKRLSKYQILKKQK